MLGIKRRDTDVTTLHPQETPRVEPWGELGKLHAEMDRLFGNVLGPIPWWGDGTTFTPAVDLYETEGEIGMNVYLPGMALEDIHLQITGRQLVITGERKPAVPEKGAKAHLTQGAYGRFEVRYTLPTEILAAETKAVFRNGMLEVKLPKREPMLPQTVDIPVEG